MLCSKSPALPRGNWNQSECFLGLDSPIENGVMFINAKSERLHQSLLQLTHKHPENHAPHGSNNRVRWLPRVIQLFRKKPEVTAEELAFAVGSKSCSTALGLCRKIGLPLKPANTPGGPRMYRLDPMKLWHGLERSIEEQNRYRRLLNYLDECKTRSTFADPTAWLRHVKRLSQLNRRMRSRKRIERVR